MIMTKRTVSVDSIPANNNSNIPIATLSSNINFQNFMNVSVSERKAVFASDSHQGSLGATYQTSNVTGERDMPKDRKILLYKDSVMVFLQKTFSFIEVFVLISVFLLLSSYLSFQVRFDYVRLFFWRIAFLLFCFYYYYYAHARLHSKLNWS